MSFRRVERRVLKTLAAGASIIVAVSIAGRVVDYREKGSNHWGTNAYREWGLGVVVPFTEHLSVWKLRIAGRTEDLTRLEHDFAGLRETEPSPIVMSTTATSWFPLGGFWDREMLPCSNQIAIMYDECEDFRSAIKEAKQRGQISLADISEATNCCAFPCGDYTPGIKVIVDLYERAPKREQSHRADTGPAGSGFHACPWNTAVQNRGFSRFGR